MILSGDIGGTKVNLALYRREGDRLELVREARYESRQASGPGELLDDFFKAGTPAISAAGFGVAGPVKGGRAQVTNLPWVVESQALKNRLGGAEVWLINDLAATAASLPFLAPSQVLELQAGEPRPEGRRAVLSAGTGLGGAFLVPALGRFVVVDAEPGHADFAPRTDREIELARQLRDAHGRVSVETVLSGPGLYRIYRFLDPQSTELPDMEPGEGGRAVAELGLAGRSAVCEQALQIFVSALGAAAGNLALSVLPRGGLYLGGGIAPKLVALLGQGGFIESLRAKGGFASLMAEFPVRVILDETAPLLGAAHYALGNKFIR